jgi:CBS domain-containing protein
MRMVLRGQPVSRFMKTDPISVPPSITVRQLVEDYLYRYHFGIFPVVDDGRLVGCITTDEIRGVPRDQWDDHRVRDVAPACSAQNTIAPNTDAIDALKIMSRSRKTRLVVAEGDKAVGVVSLKDLMEFISLKMDLEDGRR